MLHRTLPTLPPFLLAAFSAASFDAFGMEPPRVGRSICHAWNSVLCAPEGDGGSGGGGSGGGAGDEKKFSQADVDRIVGDRVKGMKAEIEGFKARLGELDEIKQKLADADERETKAREEAELKGKSELDQLKIQLAQDKYKTSEAEWQRKLSDAESGVKQANDRFVAHVQKSAVSDALNAAGLAKTAVKHAPGAFLSEAQIELDEHHAIKSVLYGGATYANVGEAAKQFLTDNPHFAPNAEGGAGTPRQNSGGGVSPTSLTGLLSSPPGGRA
jgi:hypothetical protein